MVMDSKLIWSSYKQKMKADFLEESDEDEGKRLNIDKHLSWNKIAREVLFKRNVSTSSLQYLPAKTTLLRFFCKHA